MSLNFFKKRTPLVVVSWSVMPCQFGYKLPHLWGAPPLRWSNRSPQCCAGQRFMFSRAETGNWMAQTSPSSPRLPFPIHTCPCGLGRWEADGGTILTWIYIFSPFLICFQAPTHKQWPQKCCTGLNYSKFCSFLKRESTFLLWSYQAPRGFKYALLVSRYNQSNKRKRILFGENWKIPLQPCHSVVYQPAVHGTHSFTVT